MGHVQSARASDTATLPYPIQQAIITSPAALGRGDWGLKRPLPLRSTTRTSTPIFRINAVDTREHITDFSSASDLTMSLQKLQALNLSVTTTPRRIRNSARFQRLGVFDANLDNTDPAKVSAETSRWKFKGPWVSGMTQGDFDAYLSKELNNRKGDFTMYLRQHARQQIQINERARRRHEGSAANESHADTINLESGKGSSISDSVEPTDGEIDNYIQRLRNTFTLGSELAVLVEKFLDLPTVQSSGNAAADMQAKSQFYEQGPPKTHPSAGITYLKSDAFLDMHPILGPQKHHAPVEARILSSPYFGSKGAGKIGIAGVVGNDPSGREKFRSIPKAPDDSDPWEVSDRASNGIGIGTPGGNRIWVQPTRLGVNSRGRISLGSANSNRNTVSVHTGEVGAPNTSTPNEKPLRTFDLGMPYMDSLARGQPLGRQKTKFQGYGINYSGDARKDSTGDMMSYLQKKVKR